MKMLSTFFSSLTGKDRLVLFFLLAMGIGGTLYFFWEVSLLTSWVTILFSAAISLFRAPMRLPRLPKLQPLEYTALGIDVLLIGIVILQRTDEFLTSPWQAVSWWFFILYAISSGILLYVQQKKPISSITVSVHLFFAYSIAAIIYKLGFGFDGFIHRATEAHILANGEILPKQPFYLGQYGLIPMLAKITHLPIFTLDVFFVPTLAAICLPYAFQKKDAPFVFWVPFLYPITLNLTTPHNIVLLLTILTIFLVKRNAFALAGLAAFVATITHPLPGVPLLLFVAGSLTYQKYKQWAPVLTGMSIALAPTFLFSVHQYLSGFGFPTLSNPFEKVGLFLALFSRPYWYLTDAGIILDTLYAWQAAIIPLFLLVSLIGMYKTKKTSRIAFATAIGLFIAAFILQTSIYFYGVASYEQGNYPMRLLLLSLLFFLPSTGEGLRVIWSTLQHRWPLPENISRVSIAVLGGAALMFSLYFSYPQTNHKARFPGHNVTKYDVAAVQKIHELQGDNKRFIVLSNALTSVAALTEYGFSNHVDTAEGEQFYYAIPTGGPLYAYFGDMLYQGQKRETMDEAMAFANVDTAYFVLHWYWGNAEKIKAGATKTADEVLSIDDKVTIFIYRR